MINLTACYTIENLLVVTALFVLTIMAVGAFITLCTRLVVGAILEVRDIEERKKNMS